MGQLSISIFCIIFYVGTFLFDILSFSVSLIHVILVLSIPPLAPGPVSLPHYSSIPDSILISFFDI